MRTTYELCENTDECQLNLYCWYGYKDDVSGEIKDNKKLKKCLPMFSQFPEAVFGWRRLNFKGEMVLEEDLMNNDFTTKATNTLEGKPVFEDYQWNGQHCKSGVAFYNPEIFSAECANPELMWVYQKQKGGSDDIADYKVIGEAGIGINGDEDGKWECDPTENENNCIFYFRGDPNGEGAAYKEYNFEVPCKCSLATENLGGEGEPGNLEADTDPSKKPPIWVLNKNVPMGYCGSILGTLTYQNSLTKLKRMLEKSECHSLDRGNF